MNIALIAHDRMKDQLVNFVVAYEELFKAHSLVATGTTGARIMEATHLQVQRVLSGPYGGDQQIGSRIAEEHMDLVIFLRDPMAAQPHEPDITALLRLCDVHNVPVATNMATAEALMRSLQRGDLDWRKAIQK